MPKSCLLVVLLAAACATPLSELPYCSRLDHARTPLTVCQRSEEVQAYEDRLAATILQRSQWQHPGRVPVRVELTEARTVGTVCMGRAEAPPSWSARDRVAASLDDLRSLPAGPECLAGTTLDLTPRLVEMATGSPLDGDFRMVRACSDFDHRLPDGNPMPPGWACAGEREPVCAVYRDGSRRTFPTYCDACRARGVDGFVTGVCPR